MKKATLLLLTLASLGGAFAQQRSFQQNENRNSSYQSGNYAQPQYHSRSNTAVYGQSVEPQYDRRSNSPVYVEHNQSYPSYGNGMNERQGRTDIDRINRDYNSRTNVYQNNSSINSYERNRRINGVQQERNSQLKTIGGALLGAVIGGLLGHAL